MEHPESTESNHLSIPFSHIQRASTDNLQRAAQHYRRTLTTLRGHPFEHMPVPMRQKLVAHLTDGLRVVEGELQRRGVGGGKQRMHSLSDGRTGSSAKRNEVAVSVNVQAQGPYELFETIQQHRILVLDDRRYAWIKGQRSDILVSTGDSSQKGHALQRGHFVLAAVDHERGRRLFLKRDECYTEHVIPKGLPVDRSRPHRIIATGRSVAPSELGSYLERLHPIDLEGPSRASPSQGSTAAFLVRPLRGIDFPASKQALLEYARKGGASREVLGILQRLEGRRYRNMSDVTRAIQKRRTVPE